MSTPTKGYACHQAKGRLSLFHFERRDLRDDDVEFDIHYCGVCHSDLHHVYGD